MNKSAIVITAASLILFCAVDFFSRVYLNVTAKEPQALESFSAAVIHPKAIPAELQEKLAQLKSSPAEDEQQQKKLDSAVLSQYKFTLLAIFFQSGKHTAVLSAKDIKTNKDEMIKLTQGEQYSGITAASVEQKIIEMQYQQQSIKLRLFDNVSSQERESL